MVTELVDVVIGPFGSGVPWPAAEQLEAPWVLHRVWGRRGFRRRGVRPKPRKLTTAVGKVALRFQRWSPAASPLRRAARSARPTTPRTEAFSPIRAGPA